MLKQVAISLCDQAFLVHPPKVLTIQEKLASRLGELVRTEILGKYTLRI